jgi:hypothetical protein
MSHHHHAWWWFAAVKKMGTGRRGPGAGAAPGTSAQARSSAPPESGADVATAATTTVTTATTVTTTTGAHANRTCPTDCILQLVSRDHQDRLRAYFDDPDVHKIIFPSAECASSVEDVGGDVSRRLEAGKSFLQLNDIRGSPAAWVQWMTTSPVRFVVTRMFFLDGGERGKSQTAGSLDELVAQLGAHAGHGAAGPIRLQFGPRSMEQVLLDRFESMGEDCPFEFHPVHSTASLHVFQYVDGTFRWSMRRMDEHFFTSPDGPTRVPGSFTKAAAKLAEALMVGGMALGIGTTGEPTRGRVAVDVGASPGGWTHQLAVGQGMETVISIDPAELHESVLALENVHHVKKTSQTAGEDIERILGPGRSVSVLTCDANRHPSFMAEMLAPVVKYLMAGGLMVITMKFAVRRKRKNLQPAPDDNVEPLLRESFKKFGYDIVVRRLCSVCSVFALFRMVRMVRMVAVRRAHDRCRPPRASRLRLAPVGHEVGTAALEHVLREDGPVPLGCGLKEDAGEAPEFI